VGFYAIVTVPGLPNRDKELNMPELEVHSLLLKREDISEHLLVNLLGRVFHFTSARSWNQIRTCGYIDANQEGKHRSTSVHSNKSMGRHLGAVCLFDLRNKSEDVLRKDWIFYDYFERRWNKDPSYFLLLRESCFPTLTMLGEINSQLREEMMYIPQVESWHVGNLPLNQVEMVYQVQIDLN